MQTKGTKQICENRQARHEYFILERYEAGISLQGNEVKSIRQGHVNLKDAWCDISDGELFIKGMHITPMRKTDCSDRPYAGAEITDASSGDQPHVRQGEAGRSDIGTAFAVF